MDDLNSNGPECSCSFCGKNQEDVEKLIAGPDVFVEHGPQKILRSEYGIDVPDIVKAAKHLIKVA